MLYSKQAKLVHYTINRPVDRVYDSFGRPTELIPRNDLMTLTIQYQCDKCGKYDKKTFYAKNILGKYKFPNRHETKCEGCRIKLIFKNESN